MNRFDYNRLKKAIHKAQERLNQAENNLSDLCHAVNQYDNSHNVIPKEQADVNALFAGNAVVKELDAAYEILDKVLGKYSDD
jgi:hypothetical protein